VRLAGATLLLLTSGPDILLEYLPALSCVPIRHD
jgi:hypothetical protein